MAPKLILDPDSPDATTSRLVTNSAASRLLQLPRELRDVIYSYTVVEPGYWERRNKPSCKEYNPSILLEWPPFEVSDFEESKDESGWGWRGTHGCAKRRGLGLLSVNKQIHQEASPIFWDNNTVCYREAI